VCNELGWKPTSMTNEKTKHKEYTRDLIQALISKGKTYEMRATRVRLLGVRAANQPPSGRRTRISTKNPTLPPHRLLGDPRDHIRADAPRQRKCRMCAYLFAVARKEGLDPLPAVRRPMRWCLACKDNLCNEHFDAYHRRN
jgi:hypothetical protein